MRIEDLTNKILNDFSEKKYNIEEYHMPWYISWQHINNCIYISKKERRLDRLFLLIRTLFNKESLLKKIILTGE